MDDIVMRGEAGSPPLPRDNESELGSTTSNPLEDSEYVHRCKARHIKPSHVVLYITAQHTVKYYFIIIKHGVGGKT